VELRWTLKETAVISFENDKQSRLGKYALALYASLSVGLSVGSSFSPDWNVVLENSSHLWMGVRGAKGREKGRTCGDSLRNWTGT
jgi:hypothetical protein